jgi:RHH-type proline utilization regulon transcriptional repressor/proline dehydrogenase/delta 1-pyrroline-5-carboxylate dehydrogenase
VIDAAARDALVAHIEKMRAAGMRVVQVALPAVCANGTFVPPTLIELDRIDRLEREVFGPVLHVVRYDRDALPALIDAINATGYALTHGIQSRIDETVDDIVTRVHAGNVYVNRNIIGAVVGVQPFGGDGLSGTGPKAGGPLYVRRLVRMRAAPPAEVADAVSREPLPGPTGETNRWQTHPRGTVACVAPDAMELRRQVTLVLARGNRAVMQTSVDARSIAAEFPAGLCTLADDVARAAPDAWLLAGDAAAIHEWRQRIAAQDGRIVPVIARDPAGGYDSDRLVTERVVTVNTTASGGNAELLAITA